MENRKFINEALSQWMKDDGPESAVVISSRVRFARNLKDFPFPLMATEEQSLHAADKLLDVAGKEQLNEIGNVQIVRLAELNPMEKLVLVEKHLISPTLANHGKNGALILGANEDISIMINEEDHLRIQSLCPGFQIHKAWKIADQVDDIFSSQVEYAFDKRQGYLTNCPTNLGTGIRASVMMHLPALALTGQINRILSAVSQVGLAVRGIYGEGSEATGNLFQISNQVTLGQSEEEIIDNLYQVVKQIIEHEKATRERMLAEDSKIRLEDRIKRSYGILMYAMTMDSKEAAQRLSDIRLGLYLGLLPELSVQKINELLITTQPGFLQILNGRTMSPKDRDQSRADIIRSLLASK